MRLVILALLLSACRLDPAGLQAPPDAAPDAAPPCGGPCPDGDLCVLVAGVDSCYKLCGAVSECPGRCCLPVSNAHSSVCADPALFCPVVDGGTP